ncbi:MAG: hypothetical protein GY757_29090 [bacterium]|nr:hypothetical protein [bacterium]
MRYIPWRLQKENAFDVLKLNLEHLKGKIDILIDYRDRKYGIELKTFSDVGMYKKALIQVAQYGSQLDLKEISLVFFIESIDETNRKKYEVPYTDTETGVKTIPILVETG